MWNTGRIVRAEKTELIERMAIADEVV